MSEEIETYIDLKMGTIVRYGDHKRAIRKLTSEFVKNLKIIKKQEPPCEVTDVTISVDYFIADYEGRLE